MTELYHGTFDADTGSVGAQYGCSVAQITSDSNSGAGCLEVTLSSQFFGFGHYSPLITGMSAGSSYDFSVSHRQASGTVGAIDMQIVWLDASAATLRTDHLSITPGATWVTDSTTLTAPVDTASLAYNGYGSDGNDGAVVHVDDVVLAASGGAISGTGSAALGALVAAAIGQRTAHGTGAAALGALAAAAIQSGIGPGTASIGSGTSPRAQIGSSAVATARIG